MRMPVTFETRGGLQFAKCAIALALADGVGAKAARIARERWGRTDPILEEVLAKGAVPAGTVDAAGWADSLVATGIAPEFVMAERDKTVIGRLANKRSAPFMAEVPVELAPAGAAWVGGGAPTPVAKPQLGKEALKPYKAAVIISMGAELMKAARPGSEEAVLAALIAGVASFLDSQFLHPAKAEVSGLSPASITHGANQIISTGVTADKITDDLSSMVDCITTDFTSPVWIMPPRTAARMGALGVDREIKIAGGSLFGIPVLCTRSARPVGSPDTGFVVLLDQADILVADEGRADVLASEATSIELLDNPSNASHNGTAANMTSMYQTHSIAFRVTREISWKRAHAGSVAYMETAY